MCLCKNCIYRKKSEGEWYCVNPDSENYSLEIDRNDSCMDGELKEEG